MGSQFLSYEAVFFIYSLVASFWFQKVLGVFSILWYAIGVSFWCCWCFCASPSRQGMSDCS